MEVSLIAGIRAMNSAAVPRDEFEVPPPFALKPSGRMADDAYRGAHQETERGLEEEDDEVAEEADSLSDTITRTSDSKSRVSFFA